MKYPKKPKKRTTKPLRTRLLVILDESGSMASCKQAAIDGFNSFVRAQASEEPDAPITFVTFNTTRKVQYDARPASQAPMLNPWSYSPNHGTALYDAICETLQEVTMRANERVVCCIITDGEENSSRRHGLYEVQRLIAECEATQRWTFTYIGAHYRTQEYGQLLGIPAGNILKYDATPIGTQDMAASLTAAATNYRQSGASTSTRFFTDLGNLKATQAARIMDDVSADFAVRKVKAEQAIAPFCADAFGEYQRGKAFYQLTKPETVQGSKNVAIRNKKSGAIYAGADARAALQLPNFDVKVQPGNHGEWDIFVQSTSFNRILVRGTDVLYEDV